MLTSPRVTQEASASSTASSISVIICTIRRLEVISRVLECLELQTYRGFEILVIGNESGPDRTLESVYSFDLRCLPSPKGLAQARNVGLRHARGAVYCFLDDDVELPPDFLSKIASFFEDPSMKEVGGITGFDTENYSSQVSRRWRLRSLLRITPSLTPGDASHLGRSVPFSFFRPFQGYREVKWLPGFCQIFRRSMVEGMRYHEQVEVEDREFSMRVGDKSRLLIWGDLQLAHKQDTQARHSPWRQTWRAAFGLGHSFASRSRSWRDWITIVHVPVGELIIDVMMLMSRPSAEGMKVGLYRIKGYFAGLNSARSELKLNSASQPGSAR